VPHGSDWADGRCLKKKGGVIMKKEMGFAHTTCSHST
jgi:hypothetical protein